MPRLINAVTRTDDLTAAVNDVILERGVDGLTMRAISEGALFSTSSLYHHYGSREYMLRIVAYRTGAARLAQIRWRIHDEGPAAWLPRDDEDLLLARVWLGWCEMWRAHDWLAHAVEEARADEMAELARHYDYRLVRDDLDTIMALIEGLLVAICHPRRPLGRDRARGLLERAIERFLADGNEANAA